MSIVRPPLTAGIDTVKRGHLAATLDLAQNAWRGDVIGDAVAAMNENDASALKSWADGTSVVILADSESYSGQYGPVVMTPVSFTDETGERYYVFATQVVFDSDTNTPTVDADITYLAQKAKEDDAMMPLFWLIAILGFIMANR